LFYASSTSAISKLAAGADTLVLTALYLFGSQQAREQIIWGIIRLLKI